MRISWVSVATALFLGCDSPTDPWSERHVEVLPSTAISGVVGAEVTPVPAVRITDAGNRPLPGLEIAFSASNGGSVASGTARTDGEGVATPGAWTLGHSPGEQQLTVAVGRHVLAVIAALAVAGPPFLLAREDGNAQVAGAGEALPRPLQLKVVDAFGNPVPGETVTFAVESGQGVIDGDVAMTDSGGVASSGVWTLGSASGVQEVKVAAGEASVVFTAFARHDGVVMLIMRGDEIYRSSGPGSSEVLLTTGVDPAWSPDGSRIAFARSAQGRLDIHVMNADGSNVVRLTDPEQHAPSAHGFSSAAWSPDGGALAVQQGYVEVRQSAVYIVDVSGGAGDPVLLQDRAGHPAWSPDGRRIALVSLSDTSDDHALHVMNADGSDDRVVVPRGVGSIYRPRWSPDGSELAFSRCTLDACTIHAVHADGSGLRQLTTEGFANGPVWSPEGALVAFALCASNGCGIYTVRSDGSGLRRLTTHGTVFAPAWSPDGRLIAFVKSIDEEQPSTIEAVPRDGGDPFVLVADGNSPVWRPF